MFPPIDCHSCTADFSQSSVQHRWPSWEVPTMLSQALTDLLCYLFFNAWIYISLGSLLAAVYWILIPWLAIQENHFQGHFFTFLLRRLALSRGDFAKWTPGEKLILAILVFSLCFICPPPYPPPRPGKNSMISVEFNYFFDFPPNLTIFPPYLDLWTCKLEITSKMSYL